MMQKVFPIHSAKAPAPAYDGGPLVDTRGRGLRDLRISVTDRCNFRCVYCMPREVFGPDYHLPRRTTSCCPSKRSRAWRASSPAWA